MRFAEATNLRARAATNRVAKRTANQVARKPVSEASLRKKYRTAGLKRKVSLLVDAPIEEI